MDDLCSIETIFWGKEKACGKEAAYFVTYFNNGDGGRHSCRTHLHAAVVEVLGDQETSKRVNATVTRLHKRS